MSETQPSELIVIQQLREWPNVALDAALDLAHQHGSGALVRAITDEFASRHARQSIHLDQP